jgi:lipopolysaccharide biosynthesis regulator YciM
MGSIIFTVIFFVFYAFYRANLKKQKRQANTKMAEADGFVSRREYNEAIKIWKTIMPQVGEEYVRQMLTKLKSVYTLLSGNEGLRQVGDLEYLYNDFFEMTKKLKKLDSKGRAMRQSLADKICEKVSNMPEQ